MSPGSKSASAIASLATAARFSPAAGVLGWVRRTARSLLTTRAATSLAAPLLARHRGCGASLLYHRVHGADGGGAPWGNGSLSVSSDDFDRQMGWIARHCRCLAAGEAIELLAAGRMPPSSVVVTFDDGYRDNLDLALPVLERYGVPAVIYVATGLIDAGIPPWWQEIEQTLAALDHLEVELDRRPRRFALRSSAQRARAFDELASHGRSVSPWALERLLEQLRGRRAEVAASTPAAASATPAPSTPTGRAAPTAANPMLTWDEVAALARHPLLTIGAHTVSHPALAVLPEAEARREMDQSKRRLEEVTGAPVEHFAYPFGGRAQVGWRESDLAGAIGFRSAYTALEGHLHAGHARHPFVLPRFPITQRDALAGLRFKLSGWRSVLENRRQPLVTL